MANISDMAIESNVGGVCKDDNGSDMTKTSSNIKDIVRQRLFQRITNPTVTTAIHMKRAKPIEVLPNDATAFDKMLNAYYGGVVGDDCMTTMNDQTMKECSLCSQKKSLIEFDRNMGMRDGCGNQCLLCKRGTTRAAVEANKVELAEMRAKRDWTRLNHWPTQKRLCRICKQTKPWSEFKPIRNRLDYPSSRCMACEI
jgi:hypothetical protein